MHCIAAFKGPIRQTKKSSQIRSQTGLVFPPEHYVEVFRDKNITAVVRLNEPDTYDPSAFTVAGFNHYEMYFDDCTVPNNSTVLTFLRTCAKERGVAVHCKAGLGRTGTLIAAYMMKHNDFTASECIGWLRIMRPGSVIGAQQHYLHFLERTLCPHRAPLPPQLPDTNQNAKSSDRNESGAAQSPASMKTSTGARVQWLQNPAEMGMQVAAAQDARARNRANRSTGMSVK